MEKRIQGTFITIRRLALLMLITIVMPIDATDYCCEFEDDNLCSWINKGPLYWIWSGVDYPNTTGIDNFNTTDHSKFEWLQNAYNSRDATFVSPSVSLDENDTISIQVYRRTPSILTQFNVIFERREDLYPLTIFSNYETGWINLNVKCGTAMPCCTTYPCDGWFKVEGHIGNDNELIAFKHFLVNQCPIITTTLPPPTELPSYTDVLCNRFESSTTEWDLGGWHLSQTMAPDWTKAPEFTYDSDYAFSQNYDGAKLISPSVKIDNGSEISFDYYGYSNIVDIGNSMIVYFNDMDAEIVHPLTMLQDTKGNWTTFITQCSNSTPCCNVHPCSGQFIWEATEVPGSSVLYAIDNLQLNKGCVNTPTCCEFEASSICDMNSSNSLNSSLPTDGWIWSGEQQPDLPVPPSDGRYVWREDSNRVESPATATLQSQLVTIYPNSTISATYYVAVSISTINSLYINFHRQSDDAIIRLDFLSVDSVTWIPVTVKCQSIHSNCCADEKGCTGWMEFTTLSDGIHPAIFAIDNLQLDSQCNV